MKYLVALALLLATSASAQTIEAFPAGTFTRTLTNAEPAITEVTTLKLKRQNLTAFSIDATVDQSGATICTGHLQGFAKLQDGKLTAEMANPADMTQVCTLTVRQQGKNLSLITMGDCAWASGDRCGFEGEAILSPATK